jgi:hypothetical protein
MNGPPSPVSAGALSAGTLPAGSRPAGSRFSAPRVLAETAPNGSVLLRSADPLGGYPATVIHSLRAGDAGHGVTCVNMLQSLDVFAV